MGSAPASRFGRLASVVGLLFVGVLVGALGQQLGLPGKVRAMLLGSPRPAARPSPNRVAFSERSEVPIEDLAGKKLMVVVCAGQSNAANYGDERAPAQGPVYNFYLGKLYRAEDPMLGAGGDGGSVWTRLGDQLVESGQAEAVVFAPVAASNTAIVNWAPGGYLHPLLLDVLGGLKAAGLPPTHILWQQGESDTSAGTTAAEYEERFRAMAAAIRGETDAPIFVALASRNLGEVGPEVRRAQEKLVSGGDGIQAGPDVDALVGPDRNAGDRTHLSASGLAKCAGLWLEALKGAQAVSRASSAARRSMSRFVAGL